ncbi:MAG: hypothetical protein SVY53_13080 [Chloroflexota bacterium]|nr:hypothetical protein [Chloroflexota bacterium]
MKEVVSWWSQKKSAASKGYLKRRTPREIGRYGEPERHRDT